MAREILFSGDELELLNALDRAGCVLTDAGRFSCDMEKDALPFNSRLPVRFKGEYHSAENGWKITYRMQPAPRTVVIGGIFALLMLLAFRPGALRHYEGRSGFCCAAFGHGRQLCGAEGCLHPAL